jgi:hypothetical protein
LTWKCTEVKRDFYAVWGYRGDLKRSGGVWIQIVKMIFLDKVERVWRAFEKLRVVLSSWKLQAQVEYSKRLKLRPWSDGFEVMKCRL